MKCDASNINIIYTFSLALEDKFLLRMDPLMFLTTQSRGQEERLNRKGIFIEKKGNLDLGNAKWARISRYLTKKKLCVLEEPEGPRFLTQLLGPLWRLRNSI